MNSNFACIHKYILTILIFYIHIKIKNYVKTILKNKIKNETNFKLL